MAEIKGIQTVDSVNILSVDIDPSIGLGTPAPIGSLALAEDGSGTYYKSGALDTDWFKTSDLQVDITRVDLQTKIATSALIKGLKYAITDFQDKNVTDVNSRIIVTAASSNTISQSGLWKRLSTNRAYGAFAINTGAAGSVDQITVGGTPLMTAPVAYTASRINTANLVAANVNANSVVSGYRASVVSGETVIDIPAIIIESNVGGVNTSAVVVSVTTLTITNLVNLTMGRAEVEQVLDISYDITADRITSCYDNKYNVRMTYTTERIATLTYNPIVNWRWGHDTFRNWTFYNVGYRNFFDFPSTSGVNTIEQNNNLIDGSFENVVLRRASPILFSLSNNTSNLNFSNVQALANSQIFSNNIMIQLSNVTTVSTLSFNQNIGNYNRSSVSNNTGRILINNTSSSTSITCNFNSVSGQIQSSSSSFTAGLTISSNNIVGSVTTSNASHLQSVNVSNNNINGSVSLPSGVNLNYVINISGNSLVASSFSLATFNISVAGKSISLTNNTLNKSAITFNTTSTDNYSITESYFDTGGNILTLNSATLLQIANSSISTTINNSTMLIQSFIVSDSILEFTDLSGGSLVLESLSVTNSRVRNLFYTSASSTITIVDSDINGFTLQSTPNNSDFQIVSSNFENVNISVPGSVGNTITVLYTGCRLFKVIKSLIGTLAGVTYNFEDSDMFDCEISTSGVDMTTFNFINNKCDKLTITNTGASPNSVDISGCSFDNVNLGMSQSAVYILNNSTFSYCTVNNNDGGSFSFYNSIIQYTNLDFTPDLGGTNYDFTDLSIIKNRGLYKSTFTFDGGPGTGQAGVTCSIMEMIGQDVLKAIITKATISTVTGLTAAAGTSVSLGNSIAPNNQYVPTTLVSSLNADYQLSNNPLGVANNATKYTVTLLPTVNDITAGLAEVAIEFLIAP